MKFIVGIFLIMTTSVALGQESKKYLKFKNKINYREGYILKKDSTKEYGLIKDPQGLSKAQNFKNIIFFKKNGDRLTIYPYSIKGYGYKHHRGKFESDGKVYYRLRKTGKRINLYERDKIYRNYSGSGFGGGFSSHKVTKFFVKKPNEEAFKLAKEKGFIAEFSEYFGDCEELKQKILKGMLHYKDIEKIVNEYNNCK